MMQIALESKNIRNNSEDDRLIHDGLDLAASRLTELHRIFEVTDKVDFDEVDEPARWS